MATATGRKKNLTSRPKAYRIRRKFALTQPKFARVMGISVRRLADLEQGVEPSEQVKRRITEVDRLRRELATVVNAEKIGPWMDGPNKAFGNRRPIQVIEDGEIDLLWAMIYDLKSGNPQ